jgi:4-amino-4-deoxy-L-arabinose transferase-like glycosyltransferase
MLQRANRWRSLAIAGGLGLLILYCYGLDRIGIYGPDEPRYASIARQMARTGDYLTPILWGQPWFEKPPLLYWIAAAGYRAGLSSDLAPRLPVALFSVAFLIAFFYLLRREFGASAACYSTAILATSGGWIALSQVAVTDVPAASMFGLALIFTLPWLRTGDRRWLNAAAIALAAAFLAKSAPALVLSLPVLWFGRERWRDLFRPTPVFLFLLVAAPWHILCALRNGPIFLRTLFWQQQIERFFSPSLQHVQQWWFYLPWLTALLFPWTPVLTLLVRRELYTDRRLQFLAAVAVWGLVFFSASTNKLPTYLLPLLPPIAIVAGIALERTQLAGRIVVGLCGFACCAFPPLVTRFPSIMSRNPDAAAPAMPIALSSLVLVGVAALCFVRTRGWSVAIVATLAAAGYLWIKVAAHPFNDLAATARPVWREMQSISGPFCAQYLPRDWRYGLNYYIGTALPDCSPATTGHVPIYFQNHQVQIHRP